MKFEITQIALLKALKGLNCVTPHKKHLDESGNDLIELNIRNEGKSTVTTLNNKRHYPQAIIITLPKILVINEGVCLIKKYEFVNLIKNISKKETIKFELTNNTKYLDITTTITKTRLTTDQTSDIAFSNLVKAINNDRTPHNYKLKFSKTQLGTALTKTLHAVSDDELVRPFLCGINWKLKDNILTITSTNGFVLVRIKLAMYDQNLPNGIDCNVIIGSDIVRSMLKLIKLDKENSTITVGFTNTRVEFNINNITVIAGLFADMEFPNCDPLIPVKYLKDETITPVVLSTKEVLGKSELLLQIGNSKRMALHIQANDSKRVIFETILYKGENEHKLDMNLEKKVCLDICLNPQFLIDCLSVLSGEQFVLYHDFNKPANKPILILNTNQDIEDECYLIMPMKE